MGIGRSNYPTDKLKIVQLPQCLYFTIKIKNTIEMENEFWKDIKEYEGMYEVSNLGRVKSLKRERISRGNSIAFVKERILAVSKDSYGYPVATLYRNNEPNWVKVHRLVAESFIENVYNKPEVNHKNGIRNDNRVENLEWCTQSENSIHKFRVLKSINGRSIITADDAVSIRTKYRSGNFTQIELSKEYGLCKGQISRIVCKKCWNYDR